MVGAAAHHSDAAVQRRQALQLAHVGPTQRQQRTAADAVILIHRLAAEGVDAELPLGIGGLFPHLDDLCRQGEGVLPQIVHVPDVPQVGQVVAQQDVFPDAQVVDPLRHGAPVHQRIGAGSAAGDDLQLAADGLLHTAGQRCQLPHLLRRGLNGAVAAQVHADARKMHVGQVAFHMDAGVHQLVSVPEALPQIAQIGHDDNAVGLVLPAALLLQRVQRRPVAWQRQVAQRHCVGKLRQSGDADQQERAVHACGPAAGHLLQAAGTDLRRAVLAHDLGYLRHTAAALDDPADLNVLRPATGQDLLCVMGQPVQMYLQTGILPIHGFTSF